MKLQTCMRSMKYFSHYKSPFGDITMAGDGEYLTGLWFDGQKYFGSTIGMENEEKWLPVFERTARWMDLYFAGQCPDFCPPLNLTGSDFQKSVWKILLTIPYGSTMTYGEIARIIADQKGLSRMSAQAVGGAVGHNPISVIVPCHRVIGSNGNLTGYAGGIELKMKLLKLERQELEVMK